MLRNIENQNYIDEYNIYKRHNRISRKKILSSKLFSHTEKTRLEQDLILSLVIRTTGSIEKIFSEYMNIFAENLCCPTFYNYFYAHFTKKGKGVKPSNLNGTFNLLNIKKISGVAGRPFTRGFNDLENLYKVRDSLAHGDSIIDTYNTVYLYCLYSFEYVVIDICTHLSTNLEEKMHDFAF